MIPGKNRPAGILTPYVVIVKKYQTRPKYAKLAGPISKYFDFLNKFLIVPPSVLKNNVAIGLY